MRQILVVLLVVLGWGVLGFGETAPPAVQTAAVTASNNQFATALYSQLSGHEGNIFFSPASIASAMAMTYAGARGPTAQEIARVLHFDLPPEQLNAAFGQLLKQWNGGADRPYQLAVANAFWGQQGYPFSPVFSHVLQASYGASVHDVNFRESEAARQIINKWVADQTQGKITDLMPPDAIDASTVLALTNAIYFKAAWDQPFYEQATRPGPFTLSGGKSADVPMMHQMAEFRYLKEAGFSALQMPYADDAFSMIAFLPDANDGLPAFEKSITAEKLDQWLQRLHQSTARDVRVTFPKFKMTQQIDLRKVLSEMGIKLAFSPAADLSGMNDGKERLLITAAVHKAYVDVNEKGTEAAAATGIAAGRAALINNIATFTADHPFLFVIRDNRSGSILFMGRVQSPKE